MPTPFAPPRIRKLADELIGLDTLAACGLAGEIDQALGSVASEKLLEHIANSKRLPVESAITTKQAAQLRT